MCGRAPADEWGEGSPIGRDALDGGDKGALDANTFEGARRATYI
jgi:hypothetical protein